MKSLKWTPEEEALIHEAIKTINEYEKTLYRAAKDLKSGALRHRSKGSIYSKIQRGRRKK